MFLNKWHIFHKKFKAVKEGNGIEILKNAFKDKSDPDSLSPTRHINQTLQRKTTELYNIDSRDQIEEYIQTQPIIYHFDQINYNLEYEIFR